jgi:hypothetical protein
MWGTWNDGERAGNDQVHWDDVRTGEVAGYELAGST